MEIGVCLDTVRRDPVAFLRAIALTVFEVRELPLAVTGVKESTLQSILIFFQWLAVVL